MALMAVDSAVGYESDQVKRMMIRTPADRRV